MRKIFVFLLCIIQLQGYCATNNSNNSFDITINDIPPGGGGKSEDKNSSGGLSDGAITAITLGSIFGGLAAGGIGYYFYKKGTCLTGACVSPKSNPLIPICKDSSKKKYIFIKDCSIKNKTFKRFYFKNENFTKIKVTQYSKPFAVSKKIPELDTKIFLEDKEIALSTEKMSPQEGILIKKGKLEKNEIYFLDTSLVSKNANNIFSITLEFEK